MPLLGTVDTLYNKSRGYWYPPYHFILLQSLSQSTDTHRARPLSSRQSPW